MSRAAASSYFVMASKPGGGTTFRLRTARSRPALGEAMRRERLKVVRAWALPSWAGGGDRGLKLADHAILNDQLAQLLSRGVPLVEALEVSAQTVSPKARGRVEKMRELVAAGSNFADSCRTVGGFDNVTCAVYQAAERTGDLAGAAKQLAITVRRTLAVAGRAGTLMVYPAIVMIVSLVVAMVMLVVVVPNLGTQLSEAGVDLPAYTKAMVRMGTWMEAHIVLVLGAVVALAVAAVVARRRIGNMAGRFMRSAPFFREVVLAQESARFFTVMAAMSRSGVPLADALATANQAVSHPRLRGQMERLRIKLVEGGVLRLLIDAVEALPLSTRRLLIAAERSGDLESAFNALAGDMTDEVDRRSQRLLAVMQPLMIIIMFVVIGGLLASVMVPLLTLSGKVGGVQGAP
ncbi:MAG: type II secretion system F family protein [Phycisphaerales bacterium]